mgnify:CR=1 FL=1
MYLVDSHAHLFLEEFTQDLPLVIERAKQAGVTHIFMPNIDSTTIEPLLETQKTAELYFYAATCKRHLGDLEGARIYYLKELEIVQRQLEENAKRYVAIGEIGLDLYWDKTYLNEQLVVFERQIEWALQYNLPIVIHTREAFEYIYKVLEPYRNTALRGVFHSFTGNADELKKLLEFANFYIGVNGVLTFKKSTLPDVLVNAPIERLLIETDAPYLTPVPNRGKRNESAYVKDTLNKLSEVCKLPPEKVAEQTTKNALKLFGMGQ